MSFPVVLAKAIQAYVESIRQKAADAKTHVNALGTQCLGLNMARLLEIVSNAKIVLSTKEMKGLIRITVKRATDATDAQILVSDVFGCDPEFLDLPTDEFLYMTKYVCIELMLKYTNNYNYDGAYYALWNRLPGPEPACYRTHDHEKSIFQRYCMTIQKIMVEVEEMLSEKLGNELMQLIFKHVYD